MRLNNCDLSIILIKVKNHLKKISNICINVENQNTAYIQEAHMSILHCICEILDNFKT